MRMQEPQAVCSNTLRVQGACSKRNEEVLKREPGKEGKEEEHLRVQNNTWQVPDVIPEVENSINTMRGKGQPLPETVRSFMEPRFNAEFNGVHIHTDSHAHALARSVNASAFTVGRDIVFGAGHYAPETASGKHLIAHELTHVLQRALRRTPPMSLHATTPQIQRSPNDPAVDETFAVTTPQGGNLLLRVQPTPDRYLDGDKTKLNTVGNMKSGTIATIKDKRQYDWYVVEAGTIEHGVRVGFVHKQYLQPVTSKQATPDQPQAGVRGNADDLAGTVYDSFHPSLKAALATKFPKGNHTGLADALNVLSNETVAILARIGSRIGDYDPDVWKYIKAIPTSGWITDNWGAMFPVDTNGMIAHLKGSPKWCKDDPDSSKQWHGTENCWREPAGGMPGLHIPVREDGTSDLHVDYHQPAEMGSEGNCRFLTTPGGLIGHAEDVLGGGGARLTGVAMYGQHRARLETAAADGVDPRDIEDARQQLDSIANKVRQYAAQGQLEGSQFAGDKAMAADADTMTVLKRVHILLYPHDLPVAGVP